MNLFLVFVLSAVITFFTVKIVRKALSEIFKEF